jgi:hypothetical protein
MVRPGRAASSAVTRVLSAGATGTTRWDIVATLAVAASTETVTGSGR